MNKISKNIYSFTFFLLSIVFFCELIISLSWKIHHDSPIMLYISYCIDEYGLVPYRDVFDMNMPGSYFIFYVIENLTACKDFYIRLFDLTWLGIIVLLTYKTIKYFDKKAAVIGALAFGIQYLSFGPDMSLQREYLILMFILIGIYIYFLPGLNILLKYFLIGFFFGITSTIKLHAALGLLPIILIEIKAGSNSRKLINSIKGVTLIFLGFCIPIFVMLLYLYVNNNFFNFFEMASNYWLLYSRLDRHHTTISGTGRIKYLLSGILTFGNFSLWIIIGAFNIALIVLVKNKLKTIQSKYIILVSSLTLLYCIYPAITGQFWNYHWLIFIYFVIQLSAICFSGFLHEEGNLKIHVITLSFIFLFLNLFSIDKFYNNIYANRQKKASYNRVKEITVFLENNLKKDETVQPLDWTGGAVHAMLNAKAKIATPFIYDFHFYHHTSSSYIQNLRWEFINKLNNKLPKYFIQINSPDKPFVRGKDTDTKFPELEIILSDKYRIVKSNSEYTIYQLR